MSSKLGFHRVQGSANGIGDLLRACHEAGRPVAVYKCVDDAGPLIEANIYGATTIYRADGLGDTPPGNFAGDPAAAAAAWMEKQIAHWQTLPARADYYEVINEPDPDSLAGYGWLRDFTLKCMDLAERVGYHLAIFSFATGVPELDEFRVLLPALRWAAARGHVLSLHEYGKEDVPAGWDGTMRSTAPWLATRYRMYYREVLNPAGLGRLPLYITECAPFGGYNWREQGVAAFFDDVTWYDAELQKDFYVRGCCLFTLGRWENYHRNSEDILPALCEYMVAPPGPPPEPPADPGDAGDGGLPHGCDPRAAGLYLWHKISSRMSGNRRPS